MRDTPGQLCSASKVSITPQPDVTNQYQDFFGNKVLYFAIQREHQYLTVTVQSVIEKRTRASQLMNIYDNISWEDSKKMTLLPGDENFEARQYISFTNITRPDADILEYTLQSFIAGRSIFDACIDLTKRIYSDFKFDPGFTTVSTPLCVVMKERKGVCQDFAHLAIACIRSVGLAARYISGYLETAAPEGKEKLVGVDASHAWFAVFVPLSGWIEFDPTNNILPGDQHITLAWGRDYTDVAPLQGVILSSGPHQLKVSVDVKRLH